MHGQSPWSGRRCLSLVTKAQRCVCFAEYDVSSSEHASAFVPVDSAHGTCQWEYWTAFQPSRPTIDWSVGPLIWRGFMSGSRSMTPNR